MELLGTLPQQILSWQLKGQGLDNIGTKGRPDSVPFPAWGEDNIIARVDAVGLCFSDIKLISSGSAHPRIEGRNLAKNPTVPGHEVTMTVVGVGDKWKGKFTLGSRWIIQADIIYKGKGTAFGYAIPGGLSQYVVIGAEVLEGDEGCYLLPVRPETGYAEAALVEPWTCVIASYQIAARTRMREGARVAFAGFPKGQVTLDLGGLETQKIAAISHAGLSDENRKAVEELARRTGAALTAAGSVLEAAGVRRPLPRRRKSSARGPPIGTPSRSSWPRSTRTACWACTPASPRSSCPWTWARRTTAGWSWSARWTALWRPATRGTPARPSCRRAGHGSWAARVPWAPCT